MICLGPYFCAQKVVVGVHTAAVELTVVVMGVVLMMRALSLVLVVRTVLIERIMGNISAMSLLAQP
jgi:hypothetical protein